MPTSTPWSAQDKQNFNFLVRQFSANDPYSFLTGLGMVEAQLQPMMDALLAMQKAQSLASIAAEQQRMANFGIII